jgi:shikimate kinase
MDPAKIFLTGFMCSGKTTGGKKLAALMKLEFIDLDQEIEKSSGKSVSAIFEEQGESQFRTLEEKTLEEILRKKENFVLALGGGTVCYANNLAKIMSKGLLIYIQLPEASLVQRIQSSRSGRPLVNGLNSEALQDYVKKKLAEREVFYQQAHITVNGLNLLPGKLPGRIQDAIRKNKH